jgi:hypothetical protein
MIGVSTSVAAGGYLRSRFTAANSSAVAVRPSGRLRRAQGVGRGGGRMGERTNQVAGPEVGFY